MSITDELRCYAKGFEHVWFKPASKEIVITTGGSMSVDHVNMRLFIEGIADRIDAEHQKAEDEWKAKDGQSWLNGYAECRAELMEGNEAISASLEEAGWVRLPVDADREVIRFGDTLELFGNRCQAHHLSLAENGWRVYVMGEDGHMSSGNGGLYRHYHEPTVEDVLEEFFGKANLPDGSQTREELIADYAKRLRLAGEGE